MPGNSKTRMKRLSDVCGELENAAAVMTGWRSLGWDICSQAATAPTVVFSSGRRRRRRSGRRPWPGLGGPRWQRQSQGRTRRPIRARRDGTRCRIDQVEVCDALRQPVDIFAAWDSYPICRRRRRRCYARFPLPPLTGQAAPGDAAAWDGQAGDRAGERQPSAHADRRAEPGGERGRGGVAAVGGEHRCADRDSEHPAELA